VPALRAALIATFIIGCIEFFIVNEQHIAQIGKEQVGLYSNLIQHFNHYSPKKPLF
jgi:hypothetical protein